jgi:hypothetical protein
MSAFAALGPSVAGGFGGEGLLEPPHHADEEGRVDWLDQVQVNPGGGGPRAIGSALAAGHGDEQRQLSGRPGGEPCGQFAPAQPGHEDVEQYHVWRVGGRRPQGLLTTQGDPRRVPGEREEVRGAPSRIGIVVDDEHRQGA